MFVVSMHNFKISEQIRSSAKYNRKAVIIESARRSQTEIIWFFGYLKYEINIYDVAAKYLASETSEKGSANLTRKSHRKKNR